MPLPLQVAPALHVVLPLLAPLGALATLAALLASILAGLELIGGPFQLFHDSDWVTILPTPWGGWGGGLEIVEMRLRRSRIVEMGGFSPPQADFFVENRSKRSDFNVKMTSEYTRIQKNRACGAFLARL